jgi:hypothetical protein
MDGRNRGSFGGECFEEVRPVISMRRGNVKVVNNLRLNNFRAWIL